MKSVHKASASQSIATSITAFLVDCKGFVVHSKMSFLGDAKGNASYAGWLTVHFSCDCTFQSLTVPIGTMLLLIVFTESLNSDDSLLSAHSP